MPPALKRLLAARFFFSFGVQMQAVILGWRIYELLKDPLALGMIGLAEAIPALGLALYAGYLVDRMKPLLVYHRVIFISLLSGIMVLLEHLFASQMPTLVQATMLYGAAFLTGLARSFSQPSIFAAVPRLVPRSQLMQASAAMSSAMQVARIAGPAVGGLIFGFCGPIVASSIVCVLLVIAIVCMAMIGVNLEALPPSKHHASIKDEFFSGARFVYAHPVLFPAMMLDMVSVMFGGVTALLPIFASDILHVGPKGLGVLRAAPAIGAALTSLYLANRELKAKSGAWLFTAVTGFGVCILVFGLSTNVLLSATALALSGAFDSVSMVIRSAAVQLFSPDHMRGKISAVNSIFIGSSNEIGELESGIAAKLLGTVPAVIFGGVICLLTVGAAGYLSPRLRELDLRKEKGDAT